MEDAKTTQGRFELPGGYIDAQKNLYDVVYLKEMTGHDEDVMSARNMSASRKLRTVLANCIVRLETSDASATPLSDRTSIEAALDGMTSMDKLVMLVGLRMVTLGKMYDMQAKCPKCENEFQVSVDLSTFEVTPMPDKKKRTYEVTLPSGVKAEMRVFLGGDEEKMERIRNVGKDVPSYAILARLNKLGDQVPTLDSVKGLGTKDRLKLRSEFSKVEGGMNTEVEFTCPSCGEKSVGDLDVAQTSFFFPSEV